MLVFVLAVFSVSGLLHWQVASRWTALLQLGGTSLLVFRLAFVVLFLSIPAAFILTRAGSGGIAAEWVTRAGYLWLGSLFLLWVGALAGDLSWLVLRLVGRILAQDFASWALPLKGAFHALAVVGVVAAWVGGRSAPILREVDVVVPGLPAAFDGYRIAHLSDTHFSHLRGRWAALELVETVRRAHPDLIVHTGDFADGTVEALADDVAPLSALQAPDGKVLVRGNHEAYSGIAPWTRLLEGQGWQVLANESRLVERKGASFALVGLTDAHEGQAPGGTAPDPDRAFARVPPDVVRILLAHQPRQAFSVQDKRVALQLSGHTHGGQIWPFHHLVPLQQPILAGLQTLGQVPVFVSRGAGTWGPPLRLLAPSEVPVIVLRAS